MAIVPIILPAMPGPRAATPRFLEWGSDQKPILGGPTTHIERLGSRFALDVELPPLPTEPTGRLWVSKLLQGKQRGCVQMEFPQPDLPPFNGMTLAGRDVLAAAAGASTVTILTVGDAGAIVQDGRFVTFLTGGRYHLHMIVGDTPCTASFHLVANILPRLRAPLLAAGGSKAYFGPVMTGYLVGDEASWNLETARLTGLAFTIEELE